MPSLLCIAAGLTALVKENRRLTAFLALLFGTTILYAVNYDIFDIDSYFLLSYIVVGFVIAEGIFFMMEWTATKKPWVKIIFALLVCVLPLLQIGSNRERVDETNNRIPEEFVAKAFSDFEPHAVVLASQWDYFISPSLYYQFIRHQRPDVTVVDNSLLQDRSWYFLQLERNAPWLMERIRPSADLFLKQLYQFEHELPFQFAVIHMRWQNLVSQVVEQSLPDHPVYIDARLDQEFSPAYHRTPAGLFLRLTKQDEKECYRTAVTPFSSWKTDQPVAKDFSRYYCTMLVQDASWLVKQGQADSAMIFLNTVLRIDPGNFTAKWLVSQISKIK